MRATPLPYTDLLQNYSDRYVVRNEFQIIRTRVFVSAHGIKFTKRVRKLQKTFYVENGLNTTILYIKVYTHCVYHPFLANVKNRNISIFFFFYPGPRRLYDNDNGNVF